MRDERGVGLYQYCMNSDERDLFWYYQESARDMGVHGFCPSDAGGTMDPHNIMLSRTKAAAKHSRIRTVLKTLRPGVIAALEACYGPSHIGHQALQEWGLVAGALLTSGAQIGKPLTDEQECARDEATAANKAYRWAADLRRQAERASRAERETASAAVCRELLWAMADKRRSNAADGVKRAAAMLMELGGTEWLDGGGDES